MEEIEEDWACCSDGTTIDDPETIDFKGWNDEEEKNHNPSNPSSGSIPKLQFRKDVCKARWNEEIGMAEVIEEKGGMWTSTAIGRGGKLCLLEEILFFAEKGALLLLDVNDTALSLTDIYEKVAKGKYGCSWESFEACRHLKLLGYIASHHGLPWTMKINKSCCNSRSLQGTLGNGGRSNKDAQETVSIISLLKEMQINELKPNFNVFVLIASLKSLLLAIPVAYFIC